MTPTPVGMRCPECSREKTRVRTARSITHGGQPVVTYTLIAINVLVFLAEGSTGASLGTGGGGTVFTKGALFGHLISVSHEYYRLLTSGFLHLGFTHLLFNMIFLYFLGPQLEEALGRVGFAVVYFVALLAGSFGALLFQPGVPTVGASGAAFGVLGALMVVAWRRGLSIWHTGLGPLLLINVVFSIAFRGISLGGHVGGFIGGALAGLLIVELGERRRMPVAAYAGCAVLAAASVAAAIAVAGGTGLTPHGLGIGA